MTRTLALVLAAGLPLCAGCARTETPATNTPVSAAASEEAGLLSAKPAGGRARATGTVFVTSQGLYYDTFVTRDPIPMTGPFQLLVNGTTEFGPGDPGYLGGRWWEDLNGNGEQDAGDHFFHCPLLPPGRPTP